MLLCMYFVCSYFELCENIILMFFWIECILINLQGQGQHVRVNVSVSVQLFSYYIFRLIFIIIAQCLVHLPFTLCTDSILFCGIISNTFV